MQEFKKYHSLQSDEYVNEIREVLQGHRCVVTEKIEGVNFSVRTDGSQVIFSSKGKDLDEDDSFHGYKYISKELTEAILEMYKDLKELVRIHHEAADTAEELGEEAVRPPMDRDFGTLMIRGELAGGHYPHPDVPVLNDSSGGGGQVGEGSVWYGQDKNFYAFAIEVDGLVLDFYDMGAYCQSYGIPIVPVLFFGSFDECLEYSSEHLGDGSTAFSKQILLDADGKFTEPEHLPEIQGNTREGHIISPVNTLTMPDGSPAIFTHI